MRIYRPYMYSPRRYAKLVKYLSKEGYKTGPRGMMTKEMLNVHLVIRDPRDRLVFDPGRKMNIGFAIADWLQMMMGDDDLEFLSHFAKNIEKFADPADETKVGGAYGPRLKQPEFVQLHEVVTKLLDDSDSRQAVASIYDGKIDLWTESHVVPCTLSLQFLIRHGRLHTIASMRSNDIVWGLTYDVFNFTMMQEYVAAKVGKPLGDYHHNAGSLHFYIDRDRELIKNLDLHPRVNMKMPPMPAEINIGQIYRCFKDARDLASREFWVQLGHLKTQYEKDLALVARHWSARKAKQPYEAEAAYNATKGKAIRKLLRLWPIVR